MDAHQVSDSDEIRELTERRLGLLLGSGRHHMGADITRDFFAQLIRGLQAILENERLEVQEAVYKWLFQTVQGPS